MMIIIFFEWLMFPCHCGMVYPQIVVWRLPLDVEVSCRYIE